MFHHLFPCLYQNLFMSNKPPVLQHQRQDHTAWPNLQPVQPGAANMSCSISCDPKFFLLLLHAAASLELTTSLYCPPELHLDTPQFAVSDCLQDSFSK